MRVLLAVALLMLCGASVQQEKAQPVSGSTVVTEASIVHCTDCVISPPLPFDLPAKETWNYKFTCQDVAPDWKQRVLLQTADGKNHCYNFSMLEMKWAYR